MLRFVSYKLLESSEEALKTLQSHTHTIYQKASGVKLKNKLQEHNDERNQYVQKKFTEKYKNQILKRERRQTPL